MDTAGWQRAYQARHAVKLLDGFREHIRVPLLHGLCTALWCGDTRASKGQGMTLTWLQ